LRMWEAFAGATVVMLPLAIALARQWLRWLLLTAAVGVCLASVEPIGHYYQYFHCEKGLLASPCL
jgi:hypothetical protein